MATDTTASGIDYTPAGNPSVDASMAKNDDGGGHNGFHDPFGGDKLDKIAGSDDMKMPDAEGGDGDGDGDGDGSSPSSPTRDRRMSKEWDASKVPPSRFQKRSGSIYSTPSSRDAHLAGSDRDKGYWDKMKEKGWIKK